MFLSATYAEGYIEEARKLKAYAYVDREQTPESFLANVEGALLATDNPAV
jgi:hypothetical protein